MTAAGETHSAGNTTDTNLTLSRFEQKKCLYLIAYNLVSSLEGSAFVLPSLKSNVTCWSKQNDIIHLIFTLISSDPTIVLSNVTDRVECTSNPVSTEHEHMDSLCVNVLWMYLTYGLGGLVVLLGLCNVAIISICLCKKKNCSKHQK